MIWGLAVQKCLIQLSNYDQYRSGIQMDSTLSQNLCSVPWLLLKEADTELKKNTKNPKAQNGLPEGHLCPLVPYRASQGSHILCVKPTETFDSSSTMITSCKQEPWPWGVTEHTTPWKSGSYYEHLWHKCINEEKRNEWTKPKEKLINLYRQRDVPVGGQRNGSVRKRGCYTSVYGMRSLALIPAFMRKARLGPVRWLRCLLPVWEPESSPWDPHGREKTGSRQCPLSSMGTTEPGHTP